MVNVHVYDVSTEEKVQKLNRVLAHQYSPLKLGGVFHAGIEVLGLEWAYGASDDAALVKTHAVGSDPVISCLKLDVLTALYGGLKGLVRPLSAL